MKSAQKRKLLAITFYINQVGDITDTFFSPTALSSAASQRLQLAPAVRAAINLGYEVSVKSLHTTNPEDITDLEAYDVCLIGKLSSNEKGLSQNMAVANLAAVSKLKLLGSKIILLYCDNVLIEPTEIGDLYKLLFKLADKVIYPTEYLRKFGNNYMQHSSTSRTIVDPWQISKLHDPRPSPKEGEQWKIIWFGANKNFIYLQKALGHICNSKVIEANIQLTILSGKWAIERFRNSANTIKIQKKWDLRLVEWSNSRQPQQLESELTKAHISIIPSDPNDTFKAGSSHNRVVDSVRAGCLTLASPIESYVELSKICLIGDDFSSLLIYALVQYRRLTEKHKLLREEILTKFSPDKNIKSWEECLSESKE